MEREQTTTPMQLLEMVFSDSGGVLPDMKLSEDDAIFVTESRIIRGLAAKVLASSLEDALISCCVTVPTVSACLSGQICNRHVIELWRNIVFR